MRIVVSSVPGECDRWKAGENYGDVDVPVCVSTRSLSLSLFKLLFQQFRPSHSFKLQASRLFSQRQCPLDFCFETLRLIVSFGIRPPGSTVLLSLSLSPSSLYLSNVLFWFYFGNLLPVRPTVLN